MSLKNQTVVVLGGSTGIGFATAKAACAEGARVVITGRAREKLERAAKALGNSARAVALDVADEAGTRALFDGMDRVDHIFVVGADVTVGATIRGDTAALRPAMDTRFWGSVYAAKYGAPKMKDGASITFTSGTSALRPLPGGSVASASCGAVEALARSLAVDLAPIRVNVIAPGLIDTPLVAQVMGERTGAVMKDAASRLPVRRVGRPEDIADAALFLMKNGYVTGITLTVDGGRLLI